MTNYEKIKNMSIEEMAEFIDSPTVDCERCAYYKNGKCLSDDDCKVGIQKWLESEAEE